MTAPHTAPSATEASLDLIAYNLNLDGFDFLSRFKEAPPQTLVGQTLLHELARDGDVLTAEVLVSAGADVNRADEDGRRPLHEAAFFGSLPMIDFLIDQGAAIDAPVVPFGHTALTFAVDRGHRPIVQRLIDCGARLSVEDRLTGHGLLHLAAANNDMTMTGLLITAGIDVFHEDRRGQTARDIAARKGFKDLERVLLKIMEHHARFGG